MRTILKALRWAAGEAWEKINILGTIRALKALGKKHGKRFLVAAIIWEVIESGVLPLVSWLVGMPALIPFFIIFHFEPIVYPVLFWGFRMWDRSKGHIPWDPSRAAVSAYWRSAVKVGIYQIATLGWLWAFIRLVPDGGYKAIGVVAFFTVLMTLFGFVHERVWHDSNFGVDPVTDVVAIKRNVAKSCSYLAVAALVMWSALHAILPSVNWVQAMLTYHLIGTVIYFALESVWSRSTWGIRAAGNPIGAVNAQT